MSKLQVWKYSLDVTDRQDIEMPAGAIPLHVGVQRGVVCVWCEVDPTMPKVPTQVRIVGTGHAFEKDRQEKHVGTFELDNGSLIFHVYM